jgi:RNA polymerase sigma-70 factor (ECF subfamily)
VTPDRPALAGAGAGVSPLVDHLFRHASGRIVAVLTRALGPARLDLVEEVVQEALVRALETWPWRGVPENPAGWLMQVARNRALDRLRREAVYRRKLEAFPARQVSSGESPAFGDQPSDELSMVLMCCHPELPREWRVALTLKTVSGFGVGEIARAFLTTEGAVAQRIVRAKRLIRDRGIVFERPEGEDLRARLESVLEVAYLVFNEGYGAYEGESLTRGDLVEEAIRLTSMLATESATATPAVHALQALLYLQSSRLPARTDEGGRLVPLAEQDRSRWDRGLVAAGLRALDRAAEGDERTTWHVEAGIAACHAVAPSDEATDWPTILTLYDALYRLNPSPVVALNRVVAVEHVHGIDAALEAATAIESHPSLAGYYLLPATLGHLWERRADAGRASDCYRRGGGGGRPRPPPPPPRRQNGASWNASSSVWRRPTPPEAHPAVDRGQSNVIRFRPYVRLRAPRASRTGGAPRARSRPRPRRTPLDWREKACGSR